MIHDQCSYCGKKVEVEYMIFIRDEHGNQRRVCISCIMAALDNALGGANVIDKDGNIIVTKKVTI